MNVPRILDFSSPLADGTPICPAHPPVSLPVVADRPADGRFIGQPVGLDLRRSVGPSTPIDEVREHFPSWTKPETGVIKAVIEL